MQSTKLPIVWQLCGWFICFYSLAHKPTFLSSQRRSPATDEIIVTARKRLSLQDVPVAVSAFA